MQKYYGDQSYDLRRPNPLENLFNVPQQYINLKLSKADELLSAERLQQPQHVAQLSQQGKILTTFFVWLNNSH